MPSAASEAYRERRCSASDATDPRVPWSCRTPYARNGASAGGCREGEASRVQGWLESFPRLALDGAIAAEAVRLRQQHSLKIPDAIMLATARCGGFTLATRNVKDFPLALGGVVHPYRLEANR